MKEYEMPIGAQAVIVVGYCIAALNAYLFWGLYGAGLILGLIMVFGTFIQELCRVIYESEKRS